MDSGRNRSWTIPRHSSMHYYLLKKTEDLALICLSTISLCGTVAMRYSFVKYDHRLS